MGLKGTDLLAVYRTTDATNRKLSIEELGKHFGSNPPDTNEPISPGNGDMWVDTSECPPILKIWSDCSGTGEWLEVQVESDLVLPINFAPTITGTNVVSDTLTADAGLIIGGATPEVKSYQWKSDGVAVGTDSNTYVLVNSDVGNLITCEVTCAEPDDSNAVTKAATYSQTPVADTSSASLWEEDGNAVTPIATGADLAIEGTGTFAGKITADSFDLEALPALP